MFDYKTIIEKKIELLKIGIKKTFFSKNFLKLLTQKHMS